MCGGSQSTTILKSGDTGLTLN